jgi:hypothetical protein
MSTAGEEPAMTHQVSRSAILLGAAAFLAVIPLAGSASAAVRTAASGADLAGSTRAAAASNVRIPALMLETADLPAGFRPYLPMNGPLNARRARLLGGSPAAQVVALLHGWVRYWASPQTGVQVIEEAYDAGTGESARAAIQGFDSSVLARGLTERSIGPHLRGFRSVLLVNGLKYMAIIVPFARGPYFFVLSVLGPPQSWSSAVGLTVDLAAVQSRKVPANTPNTGTSLSGFTPDTYSAAGGAVGALLGYLGIVNGFAFLRNPLRRTRRRERPRVAHQWPDGQQVVDVSISARRYQKTARLRFAVQVIGVSIAACGADPFLVSSWYIFVLVGAAIVWAGGRFIHPKGQRVARSRAMLSGSRRIRVMLMMAFASTMLIIGAVAVIAYGLYQAEPPAEVAASAASGSQALTQGTATGLEWTGLILIAIAAVISRYARRLASVDAHRLMRRDARSPVLYLRSFGDDGLKLWTATLGRPSLIERFTPRRFDAFEEVIVRHLSLRGPVVALNPPGTTLPPLGAARETIDSADWQSAIVSWIEQSALIVFIAPPEHITPGLIWELEKVSTTQHWDKTMILVPPVPAYLLQGRWHALRQACMRLWPFTSLPAVEGSGALALTFQGNAWTVITADRQNEWAYSAALREALGELPRQPVATGAAR